jgi:actin-related protein
MCEHLFESLDIGAIYFIKNSVATIFSEGRSNGIVVDSG